MLPMGHGFASSFEQLYIDVTLPDAFLPLNFATVTAASMSKGGLT